MSRRYKGAVLSATPPTTSLAGATGEWTLQQQAQAKGANTWPAGQPQYIENYYATTLYTGTGATQSITTSLNLSANPGLVWIKSRGTGGSGYLFDTVSGATKYLLSDSTTTQNTNVNTLSSFDTTGFSLGNSALTNTSGDTYVAWTFQKQPYFFDIVTWTGTGLDANIPHSLGIAPGFIMVKAKNATSNWFCWHSGRFWSGSTTSPYTRFSINNANTANIAAGGDMTATTFNSGYVLDVNGAKPTTPGITYTAYLFADDTSSSSMIQCLSFYSYNSASPGGPSNLFEPQALFTFPLNATSTTTTYFMVDNMRNMSRTQNRYVAMNNISAETGSNIPGGFGWAPNATGFDAYADSSLVEDGTLCLGIAIRRGLMATPTTGTSVFQPLIFTGTSAIKNISSGINQDLIMGQSRATPANGENTWIDKLRGQFITSNSPLLDPTNTAAEILTTNTINGLINNGYILGTDSGAWNVNHTGTTYVNWVFKRAPGFFDEVCYTGTGVAYTFRHNLTVVPELMIIKQRTSTPSVTNWVVYTSTTGNTNYLILNATSASASGSTVWNNTSPTSSVFTVGTATGVNNSGSNYVAYLFATLAGVSKVGSYTGTGATQTINCGFSGGARFVMIKRTDLSGNWYVWDTARGMTAGTDPYLTWNLTNDEVNANYVYTITTGFQIVTSVAGINASGGTYIYLAIA